jgi:aspartate/methionine/tyrosine aminotransferase
MGAPELTHSLARAHQFLTFTTPPNLQAAVAWGLENAEAWFRDMPRDLARSRDRLSDGLRREGFAVLPTQGTYFLNIDLAASGIGMADRDFCLHAVRAAGVAAIPVSALYEEDPVTSIVRLCFSKRDETLDTGIERLARARDLAIGPHRVTA